MQVRERSIRQGPGIFFRLLDRNVDVKILSCQISSERAQHFLFGSEGEFELLIQHAKDSKRQKMEQLPLK